MKIKTKFIWVIVLVTVSYSAECRSRFLTKRSTDEDISDANASFQKETNGKKLIRHKRGWGSVLFTGTSILIRATGLGLTLGAALSDGCLYYKSICTDRDEIERLDNLIKPLANQLEAEYENAKRTYYDLKEATTNNGYIAYYINHTMQMVENIKDIEDDLTAKLELSLPKFSAMHDASQNFTFQQYLNAAVAQLEYRLSDIRDMLRENQKSVLITLVAQYAIEATMNRFVKSYQTTYKQVSSEDIFVTTNAELWDRMEGSEVTVETKNGIKQKLTLVPKVLTQMIKNAGTSLLNFGNSIAKLDIVGTWKGFKGKLIQTLKTPLQKLAYVNNFLSPNTHSKLVQNYRLTWSQKIMTGIGAIGDIVTQIVSHSQWKTVRDEMIKAREKYEEYYNSLTTELANITEEKKGMGEQWVDVISVFKELCLPFKSLVQNATQYSNFSDVIGLPKIPVDTNSPLFTTDFDNISDQTIKSNQLGVVNFLKSVDNNMSVVQDQMRARQILYKNTLSKSESKEPIVDIHSDLVNILDFSTSKTMKTFGQNLKMKDIVCTVSILRSDIDEYDFYQLDLFRPRCEVNASIFDTWKAEAALKRKSKLMREVILNQVAHSPEETLSKLADAVHNAYLGVTDIEISEFGASITDRDVLCLISKEFPSKQKYDFINLVPFRPNCADVTAEMFQKMLDNATKLRILINGITDDLKICIKYDICLCLSKIATTNGVTEDKVVEVLRYINPAWTTNVAPRFCSATGCGCRHL